MKTFYFVGDSGFLIKRELFRATGRTTVEAAAVELPDNPPKTLYRLTGGMLEEGDSIPDVDDDLNLSMFYIRHGLADRLVTLNLTEDHTRYVLGDVEIRPLPSMS